jgi:hypothetical protein
MLKKIVIIVLSVFSLEHSLSAKCLFDSCGNAFVFIDKNESKTGPSVCKAKDGSFKPYSYYSFRTNNGTGDAVKLDATGLNPQTGLCKCGHAPWMHRVDADDFPLEPQTQKSNEIPVCPEGY